MNELSEIQNARLTCLGYAKDISVAMINGKLSTYTADKIEAIAEHFLDYVIGGIQKKKEKPNE